MTQKELTRDDIVGHRIDCLLEADPQIFAPVVENWPFCVWHTYVLLDNNVLFEMISQDPFEELPIYRLENVEQIFALPQARTYTGDKGKRVVEVLTTDCSPSFSLLLEDGKLVSLSSPSPMHFGFACETVENYGSDDFKTYWGHRSVDLSAVLAHPPVPASS